MRQKVLARRLRSSTAAMSSASATCGIAEMRKIEKVLRSAIQNGGFESTKA